MSSSDLGALHVDVGQLDRMLNLVGELVMARSVLIERTREARLRHGYREQIVRLVEATEGVGRCAEEIQSRVTKARMVAAGSVFRRFTAVVADLSKRMGKEIDLVLVGDKTEFDKRTIDEVVEPLVHLVRNALDHGIESTAARAAAGKPLHGTITLAAAHAGNRLTLEVRDDGAGVDFAAVRARAKERKLLSPAAIEALDEQGVIELLFHPGFSTAQRLTDLSGRGVGLDAARRRVETLGGSLELKAERGRGTVARILLPLTTVITDALLVEVGDERYALALEHVREVVRAEAACVSQEEGGARFLELRGERLPLLELFELVGLAPRRSVACPVLVVGCARGAVGLAVDGIHDRGKIVVKGVSRNLAVRGLAGGSIAPDGRVVLVLDVPTLCAEALR